MTLSFAYKCLVLDAGPLLTGGPSSVNMANFYYTTSDVLAEIKDEASRVRLSSLSFKLETRQPTPQAILKATEFAKKTGDLAALSKTDLGIIGLCLDLAQEEGLAIASNPTQTIIHIGADEKSRIKSKKSLSSEEGQWITPENIGQIKQKDLLHLPEEQLTSLEQVEPLTCMTADFALQNVLLQLKVPVCAPDGLKVKQLKSWVLRCHACFWYTSDQTRRFCDKCGGPTLIRTSYALDSKTGIPHFFLARHFQFNIRGTKYSTALPEGGRKADIILREDQKEYQKAVKAQARAENKEMRNALQENRVEDLDDRLASIFLEGEKVSKNHLQFAPRVTIGHGRRNPNEVKSKRR